MIASTMLRGCMAWLLFSYVAALRGAEIRISPPLALTPEQQVELAIARDLNLDLTLVMQRIQWLAPLGQLPPNMRIVSAKRDPFGSGWLVRIGGERSSHSLPFSVLLRTPDLDLAATARPAVTVSEGTSANLAAVSKNERYGAPLVHKGEKVELVGQFGQVKLAFEALCLEPGALGDRIRVRNRSSHRVLVATVVGPSMVRVQMEP